MDTTQHADDLQFDRQWFDYIVDASVVGNAVQQPQVFQVQTDADFEWWWITAFRTSNLLKVLLDEAGTGRQFIGTSGSLPAGAGTFNGILIDMWAGLMTSSAAFPIAIPFVLPAGRSYTFKFTDTSGAMNTLEIALRGFKLWPKQGAVVASTGQAAGSSGALRQGPRT